MEKSSEVEELVENIMKNDKKQSERCLRSLLKKKVRERLVDEINGEDS